MTDMSKLDYESQKQYVELDISNIRYIENPSIELQLLVVQRDATFIKYIKNPDPQTQMVAVTIHYYSITFIENPTKEVQLFVIKKNPAQIRYISRAYPETVSLALQLNPNLETRLLEFGKFIKVGDERLDWYTFCKRYPAFTI